MGSGASTGACSSCSHSPLRRVPDSFRKSYDAGKRRDYSQHLVAKVEDSSYASYFHIHWRPLVDVVARFPKERNVLEIMDVYNRKPCTICARITLAFPASHK